MHLEEQGLDFPGRSIIVIFPFQPGTHDLYAKGHGMYYPVYIDYIGIEHIKDHLFSIEKSSPLIGGNWFPVSLSM